MRAMRSTFLIFPLLLVLHVPGFSDGLDSNKQQPFDSSKTTQVVPKTRTDSLTIVKHGYQHRQQIITGSVVMACLALIMVTMNNYNPR